jgi:Uncharacterized conserved protein (COG2071)
VNARYCISVRIPTLQGIIKRRFLINFRADPKVVQQILPAPFQPKLHRGHAIVGICLIRLESIRPRWLPCPIGISSENAAHRVAVEWYDVKNLLQEGAFISRRDTSSWVNVFAGGRLFPGEHHRARFEIQESGGHVEFGYRALDGSAEVRFSGSESYSLPAYSCFKNLEEASLFFRTGSLAYSLMHDSQRLDGIILQPREWQVRPFQVDHVFSSFFDDQNRFPKTSIQFDHALIVRDISHAWHMAPDLATAPMHTAAPAV